MLILFTIGKVLLYILLTLLIVLLVVLIAVLFIPFKYQFAGQKQEDIIAEGTASWLFGGIKMGFKYNTVDGIKAKFNILWFKIKLDSEKFDSKGKSKESDKNKDKEKKEKPSYSYFTKDVLKKALESILKVLNHCKPRQFQLQAKVGFDDPMYTGLLYGINGTGFAILDKFNINIQPTFEDEVLEGSFIIGGGIYIGYLLLVAMEFVFTKPFKSIMFKNIKFKIKRRLKKWQISTVTKT